MITEFLTEQHEKQMRILKRIADLQMRINSHLRYLKSSRDDEHARDHWTSRILIDQQLVLKLQKSYMNIHRLVMDKLEEEQIGEEVRQLELVA